MIDFFRSRAFNGPWTFARQDYEAAKLGIVTKQTTKHGLIGHPGLVMFIEVESYEILGDAEIQRTLMDTADPLAMYGKVVPRPTLRQSLIEFVDNETDRCRIENSYWTTQPGLICMRAQKETYGFLCGCCELLHKRMATAASPKSPTSYAMSSRRRDSQDAQQEEDVWSSLLSRAPYQAPHRPDFDLLIDFIDSKRAYAEDHILELKRSPLYFAEALATYVSNDSRAPQRNSKPTQPSTPRAKGQPRTKHKSKHSRTSSTQHVTDDWNKLVQDVQYDAYYDLVLWKSLQELLVRAKKHFDHIQRCIDKGLPIKSKKKIVSDHYQLSCIIKTAWQECVRKIKPERRNDFEDFRMFHYMNTSNTKTHLSVKQKVDYLLYQLCPDEVDDGKGGKVQDWHEALDTCLGLHTVADFLDTEMRRLADSDPTSRFGAYHAKILSNLVMIAEIDRQLQSYDENFLGGTIKAYFVELKDHIADSEEEKCFKADMRDELTKKPSILHTVQAGILRSQAEKLVHEPEAVKYFRCFTRAKYPECLDNTAENVNMMIKGEQLLDELWHAFTQHVEAHMSENQSTKYDLHNCLGLGLEGIARTKPLPEQNENVLKDLSVNVTEKTKSGTDHVSPRPWDSLWSRDTVSKKELLEHNTPKVKQKTRGIANVDINSAQVKQENKSEMQEETAQKISLRDPHYTTIRALWTNEQLKDVPWKDFLRAMACVGFGLQKLGGSAWLFTPPAHFNFKHSIYMHEPHPSKSMYPEQASWRGRVLTRRYGWDKNTFILAY